MILENLNTGAIFMANQNRNLITSKRISRKSPNKNVKKDVTPTDNYFYVFSTETKEHHSGPSVKAMNSDASMDELWNLLDVIQRKGCRLRDEVHDLQSKLQSEAVRGGGGEGTAAEDWSPPPGVRSWGEEEDPGEVRRLRLERDVLLDKVTTFSKCASKIK